jgi:hypothetical protein
MTAVSRQGRKGSLSLRKVSTPQFCRPMALSMPHGVSATRGMGLPSRGLSDRPLTQMPPRSRRSP